MSDKRIGKYKNGVLLCDSCEKRSADLEDSYNLCTKCRTTKPYLKGYKKPKREKIGNVWI